MSLIVNILQNFSSFNKSQCDWDLVSTLILMNAESQNLGLKFSVSTLKLLLREITKTNVFMSKISVAREGIF
jgi:hypothetical protein